MRARPVAEKVETADVGSPETIHPGHVGQRGHTSLGPHICEIAIPRVGSGIAKLGLHFAKFGPHIAKLEPKVAKLEQHIVNLEPHIVKLGVLVDWPTQLTLVIWVFNCVS